MPAYYDIYGLSNQRDKETIEKFLIHFSNREKIENVEEQEIAVYKNEKYKVDETWIPVNSLTQVIDFGLAKDNHGFAFYIGDHLKNGISHIILKFTFDGKIIFGISIAENQLSESGKLIDNYDKAVEVEKSISVLTNATRTSIQFENPPSDDEEEFDREIGIWKKMKEDKRGK